MSSLTMQGLFALDAASAKTAMLQFQSCVRTTLLLCDGYECQEKVLLQHLLMLVRLDAASICACCMLHAV